MKSKKTEDFSMLFEQLISQITDPDYFNRQNVTDTVAEICKYFGIAKAMTEFYVSVVNERNGDGEVIVGYDNGKAKDIIHRRRIITKASAIIQGTLYADEDYEPLDEEDMRRADMVLRAMLSYISRNRLQNTIETFAFHDDTGYRNLRYFMRSLLRMSEQGKLAGCAAVRFNLKHFSLVNKDMGRINGDIIMKNFYDMLAGYVGHWGCVCRMGGDNFVAVFRGSLLDGFLDMLRGTPVSADDENKRVMITATAGVFVIPDDFEYRSNDDIMGKISAAAEIAKTGSGEDIVYYDTMLVRRKEKSILVQSLFSQAISEREFRAFYQPKVDVETGMVVGAEALCRWYHEGTYVMPADFIPVLEQTGDICILDFYMLDTVCRDMRRWIDEGRRIVRVSVNLSRKHLMNIDLLSTIIEIIDRNDVPHEYIEIELTETTSFIEFDNLKRIVSSLQQAGISTSVDDFGIGYSSLNLIREIPWDVLKVDRCFLPTDADSADSVTSLMFRHVISMARDLGLECIAEGVETIDQVNILRENDCRIAQGFLFDRPLPVEEFETKLEGTPYTV